MDDVPNCQGIEEGCYEVELGVDYSCISFDVVLSFPNPVCTVFLIHICCYIHTIS